MAANLDIRPLSQHIGADVVGVRIPELAKDARAMEQIRAAMLEHMVLRFRTQQLEPADMVAFASHFGALRDALNKGKEGMQVPGHDQIGILSDVVGDDGRLMAIDTVAQNFHTDKTSTPAPSSHYATYILRTPADDPPKHSFINMHKVYDDLPQSLKKKIENLSIVHHSYNRGSDIDRCNSPSLPLAERSVGVLHPMVRRHAVTGRPSLFLCYRRDAVIPGLSEQDSRKLMEELWGIVTSSPYQWTNSAPQDREQPGELMIWDLRCSLHCRTGWRAGQRMFWAVSSKGEAPIPMFAAAATASAAA